jgi:hypothetical protein
MRRDYGFKRALWWSNPVGTLEFAVKEFTGHELVEQPFDARCL